MDNTIVDVNKILSNKRLENELDFERASIIDRKLRALVKEHPELAGKRRQLRGILKEYEDRVWTTGPITDEKILESDLVDLLAEQERLFLHKRKDLIKKRLQAFSLSQKDLGKILGHSSATYISELVNGISPFTTHDLVIINLLLKIDFKDLIPTLLDMEERQKLAEVIHELGNHRLKIDMGSLELTPLIQILS